MQITKLETIWFAAMPKGEWQQQMGQSRQALPNNLWVRIYTDNGLVGLGETSEELYEAMADLVAHGCDVLTLGQYLQPTKMHLPVERFVTPDEFAEYKGMGLTLGLLYVESGPLVRSSYHSERHL